MQVYLLSAAGVIFLSVIVSLLIPEGKLNKTITFVMRLICILVLIHPVTGIFNFSTAESADSFFDYEYVSSKYSEHQSTQLKELILKEFSEETVCKVFIDYEEGQFKVTGVEVTLKSGNANLIKKIESYLMELGYINISVYAEST